VILYLLICGKPPFYGSNREETMQLIKKAGVQFNNPVWKHVSPDVKNLIVKMLVKTPEKRINAHQARMHIWIINNCLRPPPVQKVMALPLENLRVFHSQDVLQNAVLTFIASQLIDKEQEESLRKLFSVLDTDEDGAISKTELEKGYHEVCINSIAADQEVEEIFQHVDLNKNGIIDYSGTQKFG